VSDLEVTRYTPEDKKSWDSFVCNSKNSPFFIQRDFMEYHANRFIDYSLLVRQNEKLVAILPANIDSVSRTLISHGGLTFGGIFVLREIKTSLYHSIFEDLIRFLSLNSIKTLIYKTPPIVYHQMPSAEDQFFLNYFGGKLIRRDLGTIVKPSKNILFSSRRRRSIAKSLSAGVVVSEEAAFENYWPLLGEVLQNRHGVKPVHTLDEICRLKSLFPQNIRLYVASKDQKIIAGVVVFISKDVVHAQYIASSEIGKKLGALDLIFSELIKNIYVDRAWFSFGVSTEDQGTTLNDGLITYKEEFGGGACVHDFYELEISSALQKILQIK
jgi:hypothetical protein